MSEPRMRNLYGRPIKAAELRNYLDRTQNLLAGISIMCELMFREDDECQRRTEEGRTPPPPPDGWLDPSCRAILTVIQAAIDQGEAGLVVNIEAVRPVTAEEMLPESPGAARPTILKAGKAA